MSVSPTTSLSSSPFNFEPSSVQLHSRRLLLHTLLGKPPGLPAPPPSQDSSEYSPGTGNFDTHVVMIMAVLLCALICALGLNSVIRCALRCSHRAGPGSAAATRAATTGIKKKALKTFPTVSYSAELNTPCLASECVICLSEFVQGDLVRVLPKCYHGFHIKCIDKWLEAHSSCPTCRQCLLETCKKIVGCSEPSNSRPVQVIVPLEPEGLINNYRGTC